MRPSAPALLALLALLAGCGADGPPERPGGGPGGGTRGGGAGSDGEPRVVGLAEAEVLAAEPPL